MRTTTALCTVALALVVAGCSDTTGPDNAWGNYPLATINGQNVPTVAYAETDYTLEVLSDAVTLNSNGTFSDSYTLRETIGGTTNAPETVPCSGTWTRSGNTFTLTETTTSVCGDTGTAQWDGSNTLTIDWESLGVPAVHQR